MDTQRLILFVIFSFSILMLWDAWQRDQRPPAPAQQAQSPAQPAGVPTPSVPVQPAAPGKPAAVSPAAVPSTGAAAPARELVKVETDLMRAEIDPVGGDLVRVELKRYKDSLDTTKTFALLGPDHQYAVQTGLIGQNLPNHKTPFTPEGTTYLLAEGKDAVDVKLHATTPEGVKVAKTYTFRRGSYVIDVAHEITNAAAAPLAAHAYFQIARDGKAPADDKAMLYTFTGPAVYTEQDKFVKVPFGDIDKEKAPYARKADNGWAGMIQHYFVTAVLPPEKAEREYYTRKIADNLYTVGTILPVPAIAPGATGTVGVRIYAGPEEQDKLKAVAPGLDLVVDYGWLTVIAAPLFWVLEWFHGWLGNWGLAIIALTVLIKLIFFPLSAASYKSMARMKKVTPRLMKMRETYGDDRAKLNQAMMELYKEEKINPLGGCLPILVQIPVFIALYWVLLASVELRQAPFYGWIKDLAAPDPFFILPALMMGSMIIQTKMSPTPPDPVQAKVMMIMPFAFGVMFFFFPAGLVLYWLVNNILSIAQQWQITRMIEGGKDKPAAAKR
ncbi:MAG TPA: membrane protein insertase YidC [Burkholderiales bacterium]|nr:membrane protein insertase YidC [Burkholderiales bacterium]